MHSALRRLDLNLLPVFDAVFRHESVSQAADELSMSTSALSHALSRLRAALNDPLFHREGHRMSPSVYACQLAPAIAAALTSLNQNLSPKAAFDPAASDDCLQIAITDYTAFSVLPALINELQHTAPNLRFELRYLSHSPALNELLKGEVDLALGFKFSDETEHPELDTIDWFEDRYVVISNTRRTQLTLKDYLAARHLVVTPWNEKQGVIDLQLERLGYTRQVTIRTQSMLSAPFIVAQSDLLMTIPQYAAVRLRQAADITLFELPFSVPPYMTRIYSHRRSGKKAASDWLKQVLKGLAAKNQS